MATATFLVAGQSASWALVALNLDGTSQSDQWTQITAANYPGRPSAGWTTPIDSSAGGDQQLTRLEGNGAGGGPYPASGGLYFGFQVPSTSKGGTLQISETTPVTDMMTLIMQIDISLADGNSFFNNIYPSLTINGGTVIGQPLHGGVSSINVIPFVNPGTGEEGTLTIHSFAFQWDLSSVGTIDSFNLTWSQVGHTTTYGIQVDQSSANYDSPVLPVPEPSSGLLISGGVLSLGFLARRRR